MRREICPERRGGRRGEMSAAGTVMSAGSEEFAGPPCKRPRKDEEPPTRTIKKYFSPVSRGIEKVLSSPRSSDIADYFIRSSPVVEKECPPRSPDPNKNGQLPLTPRSTSGRASARITKQTKRTRLIRRLSEVNAKEDSDGEDGPPPAEICGHTGCMGSDTAALLAEICSKAEDLEEDDGAASTKPIQQATRTGLRARSLKRKHVTPNGPPVDPAQPADEATGLQPSLPYNNSLSDSTVTDSSLEVHVDNTSTSLLTIPYEDFLKSRAEKESTDSASHSDLPNDPEPAQQPSPKTVTIQAQVHLSPPLLDARSPTRIAPMFRKKKPGGAERKGGRATTRGTNKDHVVQKRRSNVVIEEEDLELAVIDVETMEPAKPRSTAAERQQFMKAFRQAGETPKNAPKKCAGRKKDPSTNMAEGADHHNSQGDGEEPADKEDNPGEDKLEEPTPKVKRPLKRARNVDPGKTATPSINERKAKPKPQSPEVPESTQQSPVLRRSVRRQRSDTGSPSRTMAESPVLMSTPKEKIPLQNSDLYKSEVLTVPSDIESPIRMRFTRITRRISGGRSVDVSDEAFTPGRKKVSSNTKKINKAKQILEKAKAIQQNIARAETPQRRSARQKKHPSQECIVIDDTSRTPISQSKEKRNLRSLNDVLGKKEKTKSSASGQKKEVKKKTLKCAVISIDDGSDASENSQDDEQFKAKREFLKSGLPDSLKRHIAKTTALREAYALSSLSFHSVLHVQQRDGCEKWNLAMPRCPLLKDLVPVSVDLPDVASFTMSIGDFTSCSVSLALQQFPDRVSRRPAFSEVIRDCLLEEIRCYNPQFPVRRFFTQFLKKQNDYLALQDTNKPGGQQPDRNPTMEEAENGAKRKGKDSLGLKSKKRKGVLTKDEPEEEEEELAGKSRKKRLSRGSLRRNAPPEEPDVIVIEEATAAPDTQGPVWEDVLWTEKYQPQSSSELIGNSVAVRKLHSWLRDWKTRAEKEEKKTQMQKTGKDKNDTWDQDDFNDEDSDEDSLCNTVLITGPPGVGKTAAVYACAQELGFKVFEVNASCQRSGRQILAQLKEATQSHQVDQQGVNAHKPCFFSSHSLGKSPRKIHSPKAVVSSPRKPPMSPRGGKKDLAPKSLANFFKVAPKQKSEEKKAAPDPGKVSGGKTCENKVVKPFISEKGAEETQRKSATSLILFEEVDVIFDDDSGFLSAIKTFMSTTKRPVILTTSDGMFGTMFDGFFEDITFHTPSVVNVASYLQVLCLAENLRMDTKDLMTLLTANTCDIRQSVLQLQFWARSGGGRLRDKELPPPAGIQRGGVSAAEEDAGKRYHNSALEINPKELPGCNFGCAENLMGLSNVIPPTEGLLPFLKGKISKPEESGRIIQLLSEFQSRNKDFISTNLEYLLPLPLRVREPQVPAPCEVIEPAPPTEDDNIKMSSQMKRRRKLVLLNDSDLFDNESNSLDGKPPDKNIDEAAEESRPNKDEESGRAASHRAPIRRTLTGAELKSSSLVFTCLDSLATFADNLSYLDCCTCLAAGQEEACNLNWTESRLRHGLCDSLRIEMGDGMIAQSAGEIRAHIEGLAFHKCSSHLTKALDTSLEKCRQAGRDPTEELTIHVSKSREEVYFGHPFTFTKSAESRLSIVRTVLSNKAFTALGNRQVNVTEYLPTLRSICRIEKAKEVGKTKRRFLHYLEGIHLEFPKTTLNSLAADFP
ncbi:ATPase family AAA domain-containing protein 5 isoform X2 [Aquarana catesbeiana]|uniref:ATPase family AAA domain-containing protein 5 isoform X2 n=1 Tax=Aquarana catesbeiana TaxID=8400 RepID=UPI003CC94B22